MIITFPELEDYRITSDSYNLTVERLTYVPEINAKTGKPNKHPGEKWVDVGYYPNISQCCRGILKHATLNLEQELTVEEFMEWSDKFLDKLATINHDNGGS